MEFEDGNRCFVCGMANPHGLQLTFQWDGDEYYTEFYTDERFQGYNGVLHGGISATILDEVMAKRLTSRGLHVVTASIDIRYKKPVPTKINVRVEAELVEHRRNIFKMAARVILPDGVVAVEATARFMEITEAK